MLDFVVAIPLLIDDDSEVPISDPYGRRRQPQVFARLKALRLKDALELLFRVFCDFYHGILQQRVRAPYLRAGRP